MNITRDYRTTLSLAVLLAVITVSAVLWQKPWLAGASVAVGNQYDATTTPAVADLTNLCPARVGMASSTTGTLGSVNLLSTGGAGFVIYDATTTNVNLRSSDQSTTSIRIADFQTAVAAGSYHFDVAFKRGLLIDYATSATGIASTTVSYRCEG